MSSVSNKISPVKRLSALAQLVQLYAERGITSTAELSAKTGYSDRAIRLAKAEAGCRLTPEARFRPEAGCRKPASGSVETSPLKERSPPAPPLKKIHPPLQNSNISKDSERGVSRQFSSVPTESTSPPKAPPPFWRGSVLVVSAEQHAVWRRMFPGYDLKLGYPIADAECAERGKANGAAVLHAQKKLGYLASDFAAEQAKGLSPEEAQEERIHAILRARNPDGYVDARRG